MNHKCNDFATRYSVQVQTVIHSSDKKKGKHTHTTLQLIQLQSKYREIIEEKGSIILRQVFLWKKNKHK